MDFYPFQLLYSKIQSITDDPRVPIRIRFFKYFNNYLKEGKIVGECHTYMETLKNTVDQIIPITKIRKNGEVVDAGSFTVDSFRISALTPLRKYAKHNLKFNIAVAIDFF